MDSGAEDVDDVEFQLSATAEPEKAQGSWVDRNPNWPVWLMAGSTFLSGFAGAVQPLFTRLSTHPKLSAWLVPYGTYHWSKTFTIIFGLWLIYISINMLFGKRMAWILALLVNIVSCLLQLTRIGSEHIHWMADHELGTSLPSYPLYPAIVSIIILLFYRKQFTVQSHLESMRQALTTIAVLIVVAVAYGTLGFFLLDKRDFGINMEMLEALTRTLRELTGLGNPDLKAQSKYAVWFMDSLHLVGLFSLGFGAISLFKPLRYQLDTQPKERAQAGQILDQYGRTSLDSYMLLPDKSYFFSNDNKCVIAYKTAQNVAVALSDPVGAADVIQSATKDFVDQCHQDGWSVAFLQTTPKYLAMYESLHLNALKIGEDAIVDLNLFASKTVNKKTFKSVVKKFDKDGYKLERCQPPHSEALLNEVQAVSDEWLSLPGRRERTFSLGTFDRQALQETDMFVVRNAETKIIAFVNQARSYRKGEVTIDMMRHRVEVPNGTMDFLFAKLLLALKDEGFTHFSLGLAALSGVGDSPDASAEEKAIHQIYNHMNRFFSYKGLRAYKSKFDPVWVDRFLIYEHGIPGLMRTAIALARATEE